MRKKNSSQLDLNLTVSPIVKTKQAVEIFTEEAHSNTHVYSLKDRKALKEKREETEYLCEILQLVQHFK